MSKPGDKVWAGTFAAKSRQSDFLIASCAKLIFPVTDIGSSVPEYAVLQTGPVLPGNVPVAAPRSWRNSLWRRDPSARVRTSHVRSAILHRIGTSYWSPCCHVHCRCRRNAPRFEAQFGAHGSGSQPGCDLMLAHLPVGVKGGKVHRHIRSQFLNYPVGHFM